MDIILNLNTLNNETLNTLSGGTKKKATESKMVKIYFN